MSDSRENSPDWLRSFQPPIQSSKELPSGFGTTVDLGSSSSDEDGLNLSTLFKDETHQVSGTDTIGNGREPVVDKLVGVNSPKKRTQGRKRKNLDDSEDEGRRVAGKGVERRMQKKLKQEEQKHKIWSLSSDSEASPSTSPARQDDVVKKKLFSQNEGQFAENGEDKISELLGSGGNQLSDVKSSSQNMVKVDDKTSNEKIWHRDKGVVNDINDIAVKEDVSANHIRPQVSASRLPLLFPEKIQQSKALVECEDDSIDFSGHVGAVGRVVISNDNSGHHEMFLDLKGTLYRTTIVPSRTFCVVNFGPSEAKIEAIMNDFIQLKPQSNVYETETMIEGTLETFPFDLEDEYDNLPRVPEQNDAAEEHTDGRTKRKTKKTSVAARKTGKSAGGKTSKKVKKTSQIPRERKTKK